MSTYDGNSQIHYVSATNSFPLRHFVQLLPVDQNKTIYDNIKILSALDMKELISVVRSLYQNIIRYTISPNEDTPYHWICIDGLQTMFRYTQLQDSEFSHRALNDVLLRLRLLSYKCNTLKITLLFPPHEIPEYIGYSNSASNDNVTRRPKRFKRENTGTMIGDYIWKYYT